MLMSTGIARGRVRVYSSLRSVRRGAILRQCNAIGMILANDTGDKSGAIPCRYTAIGMILASDTGDRHSIGMILALKGVVMVGVRVRVG